jgi:hypothetical protein
VSLRGPQIPQEAIKRFGEPEGLSRDWARWRHSCASDEYTPLLYSFRSGWLHCQLCGFKMGPRQLDTVPEKISLPAPVAKMLREETPTWNPPTKQQTEYLMQRGLQEWEAAELCVHNPHQPYYAVFRLIEDGQWVGWHGRKIAEKGPLGVIQGHRWISPAAHEGWASTKETCWGLDRIVADYPVYVCEGIFDALYFEHGVALMGVASTEIQRIKVLDRLPSKVILVLDADISARAFSMALASWKSLNRWITIEIMHPPAGVSDFGQLVEKGERQTIPHV